MIVLGIDTATQQVGCALGGMEGVLASFQVAKGRRHAETLAPAIQFVCHQAQLDFKEISVVAVDTGPGLFTGLRVGIATGKAIAQALRIPMIGLSSLDLLAFVVRHTPKLIASVIDARRGEVFYGLYRQVGDGVQRLEGPRLCTPDELAGTLMAHSADVLLVGDGALRYRDRFAHVRRAHVADAALAYPSAAALVELAHPLALHEEFVQPSELEVVYLRKSDAEINWERKGLGD